MLCTGCSFGCDRSIIRAHFGRISISIGEIFLKHRTSHYPRIRHVSCKFNCDLWIRKVTLLGKQSRFSAAPLLPLVGFSWNITPRTSTYPLQNGLSSDRPIVNGTLLGDESRLLLEVRPWKLKPNKVQATGYYCCKFGCDRSVIKDTWSTGHLQGLERSELCLHQRCTDLPCREVVLSYTH